jgi:hypothetical protein
MTRQHLGCELMRLHFECGPGSDGPWGRVLRDVDSLMRQYAGGRHARP